MNRLGFNSTDDPEETLAELEKIVEALGLPNLTCDALYSHLYNSTVYDDAGREECYGQYNRFIKMRYLLKQRGYTFPNCHICNSGGVVNYPEMKLDMCRTGSLVCGVQPGEMQLRYPAFRHVLELKTRVALLREVKKGECVGYSSNFIAGVDMKVAVVSWRLHRWVYALQFQPGDGSHPGAALPGHRQHLYGYDDGGRL